MKPAEAVSSSGLGTIRPDRQILNQLQQFYNYQKKKIIPRRSIDSNCPDTRTVCYGSDVCTNTFGSGNRAVPATWQSRRCGVRTEVRGR
jgi:hypothetical protein